MKPASKREAGASVESRIAQLEILVDELIKNAPVESRIRSYMEAAGLPYVADPIDRINRVLAALNGVVGSRKRRGGEHGKDL